MSKTQTCGMNRITFVLPILNHASSSSVAACSCCSSWYQAAVSSNTRLSSADLFLSAHLAHEKPDDEYVNRRRAIAINPDLLDAYTGKYHQSSGATATVTREGSRLFAEIAGLEWLTLYPESDSSFFIFE